MSIISSRCSRRFKCTSTRLVASSIERLPKPSSSRTARAILASTAVKALSSSIPARVASSLAILAKSSSETSTGTAVHCFARAWRRSTDVHLRPEAPGCAARSKSSRMPMLRELIICVASRTCSLVPGAVAIAAPSASSSSASVCRPRARGERGITLPRKPALALALALAWLLPLLGHGGLGLGHAPCGWLGLRAPAESAGRALAEEGRCHAVCGSECPGTPKGSSRSRERPVST